MSILLAFESSWTNIHKPCDFTACCDCSAFWGGADGSACGVLLCFFYKALFICVCVYINIETLNSSLTKAAIYRHMVHKENTIYFINMRPINRSLQSTGNLCIDYMREGCDWSRSCTLSCLCYEWRTRSLSSRRSVGMGLQTRDTPDAQGDLQQRLCSGVSQWNSGLYASLWLKKKNKHLFIYTF